MKILLIDDERNVARMLAVSLEADGHETVAVESSSGALRQLQKGGFDAAFLDLRLGQEDGMALLTQLRAADPRLSVVVITAYATIQTAVEAIRLGAADYLPKPFTPEQVRLVLGRIQKTGQLQRRVEELESFFEGARLRSRGGGPRNAKPCSISPVRRRRAMRRSSCSARAARARACWRARFIGAACARTGR